MRQRVSRWVSSGHLWLSRRGVTYREVAEGLAFIALFAAVCLWTHPNYWVSHWMGKWALLLALLITAYAYMIGRKVNWALGLTIGYVTLNALFVFAWQETQFGDWGKVDQLAVKHSSAVSAVSILAMVGVFTLATRNQMHAFRWAIRLLCVSSILYTIGQWDLIPYYRAAFSGNASMNGTLIAITLPLLIYSPSFLCRYFPRWSPFVTTPVALVAIYLTDASIPLGVFLASFFAFSLSAVCNGDEFEKKDLVAFVLTPALLLGWGFYLQGNMLWHSSDRFSYWWPIMEFWYETYDFWIGSGTGTCVPALPHMQKEAGQLNSFALIWMHNEYLQVIIEQGVLGGVCIVALIVEVVRKSIRRPWLFSCNMAFMAAAVFNYPVRLPLHAFVGAYLLFETLKPKKEYLTYGKDQDHV